MLVISAPSSNAFSRKNILKLPSENPIETCLLVISHVFTEGHRAEQNFMWVNTDFVHEVHCTLIIWLAGFLELVLYGWTFLFFTGWCTLYFMYTVYISYIISVVTRIGYWSEVESTKTIACRGWRNFVSYCGCVPGSSDWKKNQSVKMPVVHLTQY